MLKYMKRLRPAKPFNQAGDTIVEVLIVLAVLGLAFSVSYATANRGLAQSRNAEEHSEALGVLNSQVELVRTALAKQVTLPVDATPPAGNTSLNFCMSSASNPPAVVGFGSYTVPNTAAADAAIDNTPPQPVYPAACVRGLYHTSIVYDSGTGSYDFRVRWDGVGKLGRQQEEFNYKIKPVAVVGGFQGDPVLQSPAINVVVQSIPPGPTGTPTNPTPSCSSPATLNKSGTSVTLSGPTGSQTLPTDGSSSALFNELLDGGTYTASIYRAGYGTCPGSSTAVANTASPAPLITRKIYPICNPSYSNYWTYAGPNGLTGWWRFGNSYPDTTYTQTYYDSGGGVHTISYPNYWYYVGTGSYQYFSGTLYRYYYVYDALYHSDVSYGCPP